MPLFGYRFDIVNKPLLEYFKNECNKIERNKEKNGFISEKNEIDLKKYKKLINGLESLIN